MELRAYISYTRKKLQLSYWQSTHQHEVDFILGDDLAIEVKSSNNIQAKHMKNLEVLQEEQICKKYYLVCHDNNHRMHNNIEIIHWRKFLDLLWDEKVV